MAKWIGQHIIDLEARIRDDVHVDKKVYDSTGSAGTSGQQLLSTSTATAWTGDNVVVGCIVYNSANQITITFHAGGSLSAFSGKAYLN